MAFNLNSIIVYKKEKEKKLQFLFFPSSNKQQKIPPAILNVDAISLA